MYAIGSGFLNGNSAKEFEQSRAVAEIWKVFVMKLIIGKPIGLISHFKQKISLYPSGFV